jgi:hypothetical protein
VEHSGVNTKILTFKSKGKTLPSGELAWTTAPTTSEERDAQDSDLIPISSIALIRNAKFVVKYLAVQPIGEEVSTRGVFLANIMEEEEFRKSEPVAHDDWIPSRLASTGERNPVKQAKQKILANFKSSVQIQGVQHSGSPSVLLGNLIGMSLGGLALTGSKMIPRPTPEGESKGGRRLNGSGIHVEQISSPTILSSNDVFYETVFHFRIDADLPTLGSQFFSVVAKAVVDNGTPESVPPIGASAPEILEVLLGGTPLNLDEPIILQETDIGKLLDVKLRNSSAAAVICKIERRISNE